MSAKKIFALSQIRMRPHVLALALLLPCFRPVSAHAQTFERIAPSLPEQPQRVASVLPVADATVDTSTQPLIPALKGLVFVSAVEQVSPAGLLPSVVGPSGIDASRVQTLNDPRFVETVASLIGRPLTFKDLDGIKAKATTWLREHGHPFVDVSVPPQNITTGVVQCVVTQYKLGQVRVHGARYFSSTYIKSNSGLVSGRLLALDDVQTDLDRLNRNPFLTVDAVFQPGAQTGETDVVLNAKDRLPLRFYSGYDDLGVRSLGVAEYNAGMNWGNVFGTGQILSYQFTQSFGGRSTSHSISDTVPLPWGDQVLIFGSYGIQDPLVTNLFRDEGHSGQASIRYVRPLPRTRKYNQDVQVGYDFKTTDNNLAFAGFQVFTGQAEVDQFPLVYDASLAERFGQTAIQNLFVFSPGGLSPANNNAATATLVAGAKAHYLYNRFLVTQTTQLPKNYSSITRITAQSSTGNLPYSEQVGGGGVGSVRGYYTDTALGSVGELFSQELRMPPFTLSRLVDNASEIGDKAQLGLFFDYAHLRQMGFNGNAGSAANLASAGFLVRYSIGRALDVQYDMGYRLHRLASAPERGAYGQVSITGSF